jgi:hypothetical protein
MEEQRVTQADPCVISQRVGRSLCVSSARDDGVFMLSNIDIFC